MKAFPTAIQVSKQQAPTKSTPGGPASGRKQITERTQLMRNRYYGLRKTGFSKPTRRYPPADSGRLNEISHRCAA